jgi:hypothetical protein
VILFHPMIQVLGLADFDLAAGLLPERLEGRGMGAALIDRDLLLRISLKVTGHFGDGDRSNRVGLRGV